MRKNLKYVFYDLFMFRDVNLNDVQKLELLVYYDKMLSL